MVRGVFIRNFQSLQEVSVSLGKLTVIVGSTDVGKSAFLRAIKAAVENRKGDSFVFTGAKDCQVSIDVGTEMVTWFKPLKKSALYYVGPVAESAGDKPTVQVAASAALSVLGLDEVELSRTVTLFPNFQSQLGAHFLLAESGVVKSKILGEITNAGLILFSINILKRWSQTNSIQLSGRMADVATQKLKLEKYSILPTFADCLYSITGILQPLVFDIDKQAILQRLETSLIGAVQLLTYLNRIHSQALADSEAIDKTGFAGVPAVEALTRVKLLQASVAKIEDELSSAKLLKQKINVLEAGLPDTTTAEHFLKQLAILQGYSDAVKGASDTLSMLDRECSITRGHLVTAETSVTQLKVELRVCPLCEAPLTAGEPLP